MFRPFATETQLQTRRKETIDNPEPFWYKKAMDKELAKMPYMLEKGRYIPCLDHGVTNQVPYENYLYFYDKLREIICKESWIPWIS